MTFNHSIRQAGLAMMFVMLLPLGATAEAAEALGVQEVYACKYINGADRDDLMSARDNLVKQQAKLGLSNDTFLWTPMLGTPDLDFLWFDVFDNISVWGAATDKFAGSPEGAAVNAQFNKIVKCSSSLSFVQQVYAGSIPLDDKPPVAIGVSSCKLKHGQTMDQVQDLITHMNVALPQTGAHDAFMAYMSVPLVAQTDVDLRIFGASNDAAAYAAGVSSFQTSEAARMLGRHFEQVLDCTNTLWWGEQIIEKK